MRTVWIISRSDAVESRELTDEAIADLERDGYAEFRAQCGSGRANGAEVPLFVEGWPREVATIAFVKAATSALGACDSYRVFRPDGSTVLP